MVAARELAAPGFTRQALVRYAAVDPFGAIATNATAARPVRPRPPDSGLCPHVRCLVRSTLLAACRAGLPLLVVSACTTPGASAWRGLLRPAATEAEEAASAAPCNRVSGALGGHYWGAVQDVQLVGGSTVDPGAFSYQLSYERVLHDHPSWQWGVGIDFGGSLSDVDGPSRSTGWFTREEDSTASMMWLTPTVNFYFPASDNNAFLVSAGVGHYELDIDAAETVLLFPGGTRTVVEDSTVGGFVGVGLEIGPPGSAGAVRLSYRMHLVSFDGGDQVVPAGSTFDGPIHTLLIGAVARF